MVPTTVHICHEQDAGKGAQQAIAQCLAVVCCGAGQQQVVATVQQLLKTLQVSAGCQGIRSLPKTDTRHLPVGIKSE